MAESSYQRRQSKTPEPGAHSSFPMEEGGSTVLSPDIPAAAAPRGGSSQRTPSVLSEALLVEEEKTVISKRPPLAEGVPPNPGSPSEIGKLLLGSTLGHFQLEEYVGGGGMGAVFRAHDRMLGRSVAVKVLSRDQSDEETIRRFKNEAQSSARLDHANIARVFHVGEESGWNYIVFEFIAGENIRDLVSRVGPLTLDDAISFTLQVAEALDHASRRDVVHRDIKPSNVLVTAEGRIKLVDMGLARLHQVESSHHDLTASGVTLGTFDYISPEQARDPRTADVRSDLYSLGCTLFYMLTGRPPFPEGTVLQKLLSHSTDEVPDPRQVRPDLPPEVSAILRKLTAKAPHERYQEPTELMGELMLLATRLQLRCATRGGTVWITPTEARLTFWERHLPWMAPVAILLLVVLGLDYFWPSSRSGPSTAERSVHAPAAEVHGQAGNNGVAASKNGARQDSKTPLAEPRAPEKTQGASQAASSNSKNAAPPGRRSEPHDQKTPELAANGKPPRMELGPHRLQGELALAAASGELAPNASTGSLSASSTRAGVVPAAEPAPPGAAQEVKTIVVDPTGAGLGQSKTVVTFSLSEAMRRLSEFPAASVIELRFNGPHLEAPVSLGNRSLTVRASEGYAPELLFRPQVGDPAQNPRDMIRLLGGESSWEGLHFRLELPLEPTDGDWSLFSLGDPKSLRLMNCTLTLVNAGVNHAPYHRAAAFFDLANTSSPSRMRMDERPDSPLAIDLWHTAVRGEATLVYAEEVRPLKFYWGDGLLISTGRMFEFGGARTPPAPDAHVRIDLSHVTAACAGGLFYATSSDDAPHQLTTNLRSHDCIFTLGEAPFIEQQGNSGEQLKNSLIVSGSGNFYCNANVLWRRVEREPSPRVEEVDFADWTRQWPNDKLPQRKVEWQADLAAVSQRAVSQQSRRDFFLSDAPSNLAATSAENHSPAGFSAELTPEFPAPAPASNTPLAPDVE